MDNRLIKSKIKLYGYWGFLRQGIKACVWKCIGFSWNYYYLMRLCLNDEIKQQRKKEGKIRKLCQEDFEWGDKAYFTPEKLELYKVWFQKGFEAYGVFIEEKLICSAWISYHELILTEKDIYRLPANTALLLDDYCHIDYRNKGFHKCINRYRLEVLKEKGIDQVFVVVRKNNTPALKTQLAFGFNFYKFFAIYRFGKKEIVTLKLERV